MEGLERLEQEALELNNHNIILIFNNIKNRTELQDKFNNEEKTINGMYEFIYNKARTIANKNVAMVNDKTVYLWAMTYFNKSNEELGITKTDTKINDVKKSKNETPKEEQEKKEQVSLFEEVQ